MGSESDTQIVSAYLALNSETDCSSEDITCDPLLRNRFLDLCWKVIGDAQEAYLLHRLTYLRKRGRLPRVKRLAKTES